MSEAVAQETLDQLASASTATVASQLLKHGLAHQTLAGLRPVGQTSGFAAPAATLRCVPSRATIDGLVPGTPPTPGLSMFDVAERVLAGHVLVVDTAGSTRAATGGDILLQRMHERGVAGVVTAGSFRDASGVGEVPMPTYAAGATADISRADVRTLELDVPIGCAGVAVYPGDVLVGDRDGVVVVPAELAAEIAPAAAEQERLEEYVLRRVRDGEPLAGLYPPGPDTVAAFREQEVDR
ncbi:ribonuclease activity regulator RraA [Marmoricola endophyticus]|uniref:Putative 4-hydroxy-4-methyl-2-oxoglutarate aldolase n=1 Tax=Marmoricola endophyticus TaxID=2040280 RepID=A0A917F5W6_9ACTN|nr:ribonuclease activity regulator RraA [Marmoricola endophyticus]GGF51172.1 ribonuclease activity regulator RraA [Marmoricola endophyticus]